MELERGDIQQIMNGMKAVKEINREAGKIERHLDYIHHTIEKKDYSTLLDAIWGALDRLNRATNVQTGVISILLGLILWRVW